MAVCDSCNLGGYLPQDMRADINGTMLVGPCCANKVVPPRPTGELEIEYGIELSSKKGLRAYINAGGLSIQFKKTPVELRELIEGVN